MKRKGWPDKEELILGKPVTFLTIKESWSDNMRFYKRFQEDKCYLKDTSCWRNRNTIIRRLVDSWDGGFSK
jgi:hypothetical protein